jgi:hypothetical protein
MDDVLTSAERRYHIESLVGEIPAGVVYRAFSRHRVGKKIKRRYYAIVERREDVSKSDFNKQALQAMIKGYSPDFFDIDDISQNGKDYYVYSKYKRRSSTPSRWASLQNHGYLMLLLAALIFILMIVKFFQSPSSTQEVNAGTNTELVVNKN